MLTLLFVFIHKPWCLCQHRNCSEFVVNIFKPVKFEASANGFAGCRVHSTHLLFSILPGFLWTLLSVSWSWQSCGPKMGGRHVPTGHCVHVICIAAGGYWVCGEFILLSCLFHLPGCSVKAQVARWPSLCPCYWIDTWTTVKPSGSLAAVAAYMLFPILACLGWSSMVAELGCGWGERCPIPALFLFRVHS